MDRMDHGTMNHGPWTMGRGPGYIFTKHGSTAAGGVAALFGGNISNNGVIAYQLISYRL